MPENKRLPSTPSLKSLRKQAKQLLHGIRNHDLEAVHRFLTQNPNADSQHLSDEVSLSGTQRVVAKEYGFRSWVSMRDYVESRTLDLRNRILTFLRWACSEENREPNPRFLNLAQETIKNSPELLSAGLFISAAVGDIDKIRSAVNADPGAADATCGPRNWPPLFYTAYSCFHLDSKYSQGILETARFLLEKGADPNGTIPVLGTDRSYWDYHILLCAIEKSHNMELIECLLKAGADPNRCGAYYHTVSSQSTEILDLLYRYGAEVRGPKFSEHASGTLQHILHVKPEDTVFLKWFLEHGADPNLKNPGTRGNTPLHTAINKRAPHDVLKLLLDYGADPRIKQDDGRSPVALAVKAGDVKTVDLLLEHGGVDDATPYDHLLGAAEQGAEDLLMRWLQEVDLRGATNDQKQDFLDAAQAGHMATVSAMLKAGMDIAATTPMYHATALDRAALHGREETVRLLIGQGAPLEVTHQWGGTPLGSALHALEHFPDETGDYPATVDALLRAGASHAFIKAPVGHQGVDLVLKKHGVIS